jgi:hypothetical protein
MSWKNMSEGSLRCENTLYKSEVRGTHPGYLLGGRLFPRLDRLFFLFLSLLARRALLFLQSVTKTVHKPTDTQLPLGKASRNA